MTPRRDKRRNRRGRRTPFGLPQTLSELFAGPLIVCLAIATFGLKDVQLPPIFGPSPPGSTVPIDTFVPLELQVLANGNVLCTGKQVVVEEVVNRVRANISEGQSIRLIVDENANAPVFIRIQSALSQAGLWNRVRIPHQNKQDASP